MSYFKIFKTNDKIYQFKDALGSLSTLVIGSEKALVLDTCYGIGDLEKEIRKVTNLPLIVVNSHGHMDHSCGNYQFEQVYIHSNDVDLAKKHNSLEWRKRNIESAKKANVLPIDFDEDEYLKKREGKLILIDDVDKFSLGDLTLEILPAFGHTRGSIADSDDGLTQQRVCLRDGCGEVVATRDKLTEGAVQFDDGTIAGSDKLDFSGVTLEDGASSAVTENDYITYSVVEAPDRPYDNALKVSAVLANRTSPSPNIYLSYMNDDAEGTVHTIDFDIYVVTPKTTNSGRTLFQMAVGGSVFNVDTYSQKLRLFGDSSHLFGATDTWVSIRLQFVITENGSAELTAFYKNNGVYTQVRDSHTVTGSGLKVSGITEARMYMYSTSEDLTYYIDNISYTRTECPHTFGDFVDSDSDGIRERTCTKCGETEYSEVALSSGTVNFDDGSILSNEKISVGVGTVTSAGAAAGLENSPAIQAGDSVGGNANTKFEIVSNAKEKANNCLKVTITPDKKDNGEYNYTTMTIARTDEDADGEIYVFEMDFKSATQQNTTAPFVQIMLNGEASAKFDIYPYAQSAGGVRYAINGSYVADAPTVMPHNSWVTLRVVITGQTAYTFVKSSKPEGFQLLATNTLSLSNTVINSVKFNFYKTCSGMNGATCTTYFDNISLVQTSNTSYLPQ